MGGGFYDRDVHSSKGTYSASADESFGRRSADPATLPKNRILTCAHKSPIVVAMDVTGSMGNWSKVIYDKMPMFFGQIMVQGYLPDPAISFAAVGDYHSDEAPLQVCDFAAGIDLDRWLQKLWLEGNGGGQHRESYEAAAAFYLGYSELSSMGLFFFTGDESYYPRIRFGEREAPTKEVFEGLKQKYDIYMIHKPYDDSRLDREIVADWRVLLGQNVLVLKDPKAVVDVMLGVIALYSESRTLDEYAADMVKRGQAQPRIVEVYETLKELPAGK